MKVVVGGPGRTMIGDRFASRGIEIVADKVESAQRRAFGGHDEKPAS